MKTKGFLLFDIDGVIRDVSKSYRFAIKETVHHLIGSRPSTKDIDDLKATGCWNNDWDLSTELIRKTVQTKPPSRDEVIKVFNNFYFGCDPVTKSMEWKGFIKNETLLVNKIFFDNLLQKNILYGFVSGAERPSAKFILENRLGLKNPPLIAMEDAPEKPNPSGFIKLAEQLVGKTLGKDIPPIGYIGDTVADVLTVKNAQKTIPNQKFISFGIAPPHLHKKTKKSFRLEYEKQLINAGADVILKQTYEVINYWPAKI